MRGTYRVAEDLLASQEGFCSMGVSFVPFVPYLEQVSFEKLIVALLTAIFFYRHCISL
jgi:hypothetical protein